MGELLKRRVGPLAMWAWALIFIALLAVYLIHKKNQAATSAQQQQASGTSSNLGTVPVSNLTTTAQPMPIQLGDTFVNTTVPNTVNVSPSTTVNNQPPAYNMQPAPPPAPSPAVNMSSGKAYGLVNTVKGLMYWLGVNRAGSQVYNVGGGAPVYFGSANNLAEGAQYEQAGSDMYTPVSYGYEVAGNTATLNQPYVAGRT